VDLAVGWSYVVATDVEGVDLVVWRPNSVVTSDMEGRFEVSDEEVEEGGACEGADEAGRRR
jgi:hypothetical protein